MAGLCVQGTTEYGYGVTFRGRKADVHKTLISASTVHSKDHVASVDSNGGYILYNSALARKILPFVQNEIVTELGAVLLYLEIGTDIWHRHRIHQNSATRLHTKRSTIVFDASKTTVGRPSAPLEGVSPKTSVGEPHRCLLRNRQGRSCKFVQNLFFWRNEVHVC